jgi:hypothetical protein
MSLDCFPGGLDGINPNKFIKCNVCAFASLSLGGFDVKFEDVATTGDMVLECRRLVLIFPFGEKLDWYFIFLVASIRVG